VVIVRSIAGAGIPSAIAEIRWSLATEEKVHLTEPP
jgi:hypothetical protein